MTARPRVLCVDDERMVLEGLALHLRRRFDVSLAEGGAAGLELMRTQPPFAVVVSDMRMPRMSGAEFLAEARRLAPDTVRMLLTGHADFDAALDAVNQGQIFRFLTKPCPPPLMLHAVAAAAEQHRLIESERVLLEKTLAGSIKILTDTLSLANPVAFGRAVRLKRYASAICGRLALRDRWQLDTAAQLSQIGCITLPPDVAEKLYFGQPLSPEEQAMAQRIHEVADQLLGNVPRLEAVREILAGTRRAPTAGALSEVDSIEQGARVLRAVLDYDGLESSGVAAGDALGLLAARSPAHDPAVLEALHETVGADLAASNVREVSLQALRPGMVFALDVQARNGTLLVARGHTVTAGLLERMKNMPRGSVREPIRVLLEEHGA